MTDTTKPLRRQPKRLTGWRNELGTPPIDLWGEVSPELRGNVSPYLHGDVTLLRGDVSLLRGDVSKLWGDVTGLLGNCDQIPHEARPCDISDWVQP